jgi:hypothetical protein
VGTDFYDLEYWVKLSKEDTEFVDARIIREVGPIGQSIDRVKTAMQKNYDDDPVIRLKEILRSSDKEKELTLGDKLEEPSDFRLGKETKGEGITNGRVVGELISSIL